MNKKDYWNTVISSKKSFFQLNLKETFQYWDLIVMFVKRSFVVSYKQTVLGPIWLVIKPVATACMYAFIFGHVVGIETDGAPQLLFYMAGNNAWGFLAACINSNASTFTSNAGLYGKVFFPRLVTPFSNIIVNIINYIIQLIFFFVFVAGYAWMGYSIHIGAALLLLPIYVVLYGMMGMGIGILISALTTKYRDLSILIGFGLSLWMYITPVIYPLSQIEAKYQGIMMLNPATSIMQAIRYSLLGTGTLSVKYLLYSAIVAVALFFIGIFSFNSVEQTFMDTV